MMQVMRSPLPSLLPALVPSGQKDASHSRAGSRPRRPFRLEKSDRREQTSPAPAASSLSSGTETLAYSPILNELAEQMALEGASYRMATRASASAYRAGGRTAMDHATGHLLAKSF